MLKNTLICLFAFSTLTLFTQAHAILTKEELTARGQVRHDNFVINSIPKCGTHLIMNCITNMINKRVEESYDYTRIEDISPGYGIKYMNYLASYKGANVIHKTHVIHTPIMENAFIQSGMKWVYIMRDPRDALTSLLFYMEHFKGNRRDFMDIDSAVYDNLSLDDKLTSLMTGKACTNYVNAYLKPFLGWSQTKNGLVIKYEDLIGPNSGGTREKQLNTISKIASYLKVNLTEEEIEAIAEHTDMYKTAQIQHALGTTYNKGRIGNWSLYFNESNKALFKKLFGRELIKMGYENDNHW